MVAVSREYVNGNRGGGRTCGEKMDDRKRAFQGQDLRTDMFVNERAIVSLRLAISGAFRGRAVLR
jgi:hypothetical protein